ncbi:MAG: hypothetical protein ABW128_20775, partial [Rhizorhabdus sp.]
AVAAEHPLATAAALRSPEVSAFGDECKRGSTMEADIATAEKKGIATGLHVKHPLTGAELPVFVANYVLMTYGEGAVMAVPAHDERDFEFARKYGLPIRTVIASTTGAYETVVAPWIEAYAAHGTTVDSGAFSGLGFAAAIDAILTAPPLRSEVRRAVEPYSWQANGERLRGHYARLAAGEGAEPV